MYMNRKYKSKKRIFSMCEKVDNIPELLTFCFFSCFLLIPHALAFSIGWCRKLSLFCFRVREKTKIWIQNQPVTSQRTSSKCMILMWRLISRFPAQVGGASEECKDTKTERKCLLPAVRFFEQKPNAYEWKSEFCTDFPVPAPVFHITWRDYYWREQGI